MMYLNSTSVLNGAFLSLIIALNQSSFLFCCFGLKDKLIKYFGTNQKAQTENLPKFSVIVITVTASLIKQQWHLLTPLQQLVSLALTCIEWSLGLKENHTVTNNFMKIFSSIVYSRLTLLNQEFSRNQCH